MRPLDIGLAPGRTDPEARRIRILNLLTWFSVVIPLLWCVPAGILDRWPVAAYNVAMAGASAATLLVADTRRRTRLMVTMVTAFLAGHHWRVLGPGVAVHAWFVPLVGLPLLIFDVDRDRWTCAGWVTLEIGLYALGELEVSLFEPLAPFPPRAALAGGIANSVGAAGALVLLIVLFARLSARAEAALGQELERSERLLLNVLPAPIAERLKAGESPLADHHDAATVLFADLVGFTPLARDLPPAEVVGMLSDLFGAFDALVEEVGLEKVKTIGDAYMVASGIPSPRPDHADAAAALALRMGRTAAELARRRGVDLRLRIGLHTGEVVAGVIGQTKFAYDLWGDTVNVASRMESHGEPGRIHLSAATRALLSERFVCEPRGSVEVKGLGNVESFWLVDGSSDRRGATRDPE